MKFPWIGRKRWFHDESGSPLVMNSFLIKKPYVFLRKKTQIGQRIKIVNSVGFGKMFVIDGSVQSAERDELIYHQALVHPAAILLGESPRRVLILGGGEGATLREVLRYRSVEEAVMVDIDGEVIKVTQEWLPSMWQDAYKDSRARIIITDALRYLRENRTYFDLIISDLTDPGDGGVSSHLYTPEYYQLISRRLFPGGIFVMQSHELSRIAFEDHKRNRREVEEVFGQVFSCRRYVPSCGLEQSFILAGEEVEDSLRFLPGHFDERVRERIGYELEEYSGDIHRSLFTLSPDLEKKLAVL